MKRYLLSFVAFFAMSCTMDKLPQSPLDHFDIIDHLNIDNVVNLEQFNVMNPSKVYKYKEGIIFRDFTTVSNMVIYVNLRTREVAKGISMGNGPDEFTEIARIGVVDNHAYLYDVNFKKISELKVEGDSIVACNTQSYSNISGQGTMIGKDMFLSTSMIDSAMIKLADKDGNILSSISYPDDEQIKNYPSRTQNSIYLNSMVNVSPDRTKFAYGVMYSTVMGFGEINDNSTLALKEELVYSSVDISEIYNDFIVPSHESKTNVLSVCGTEKYAVMVYSGKRYVDYQDRGGKHILIYNWNGTPYIHLTTDISIVDINYDINTNTLYGIAVCPEASFFEIPFGY